MPIFEFKCEKCGQVSEFLVGVSQEKPDLRCKKCGNDKLKKMMSAGVVGKSKNSHLPSCAAQGICGGSCPSGGCHLA